MASHEIWLNRASVDPRLPSVWKIDKDASVVITDKWVIVRREGESETRYNTNQVVSVTRFEE